MNSLAVGRQALADVVSAVTGLVCSQYPPETAVPPTAWVHLAQLSMEAGTYFCSARTTFVIKTIALRNDISSAIENLESFIPGMCKELGNIGLIVSTVESGSESIGGQELLSVSYTATGNLTL